MQTANKQQAIQKNVSAVNSGESMSAIEIEGIDSITNNYVLIITFSEGDYNNVDNLLNDIGFIII
ncbi:hypothetical protein [Brassicibacter mesophilus]|uniref:hypothetical protein n=1 Tax=Brassicibacter mesophilus TaxID=745119 RepID=UPI003D1D37EB